jgi:hypothetical protein
MGLATVLESMLHMSQVVPACAAYIYVPCRSHDNDNKTITNLSLMTSLTSVSQHIADAERQVFQMLIHVERYDGDIAREYSSTEVRTFARCMLLCESKLGMESHASSSASSYLITVAFNGMNDDNVFSWTYETPMQVIEFVNNTLVPALKCIEEYVPCKRCNAEMLHRAAGDERAYCSTCQDWASLFITRHFQMLLSNPSAHACRARLHREFNEFNELPRLHTTT